MTADIIIVTRNRPNNIIPLVVNILTGIELPEAIIIIDSSDIHDNQIRLVVLRLGFQFKIKIIYEFNAHQGISYARNMGIRASQNNIICFIDDDEMPNIDWLKNIKEIFQKRSIKVLTGPKYSYFPSNYWNKIWSAISDRLYQSKNGLINFVSAGNSCYRRKFIMENQYLYDERMNGIASEDSVLSYKFFLDKIPIYFSNKIGVKHYFRTTLKGFIYQWYQYGLGSFDFHRFYTVNTKGARTKIKLYLKAYLFSRKQTLPNKITYYILPGIIVKELSFFFGFWWSYIRSTF